MEYPSYGSYPSPFAHYLILHPFHTFPVRQPNSLMPLTPSPCQAVIVGVSVQKLTRENTVKHTMAEVQQIRTLSSRPDILPLLANSLAPSIYGHDIVKRGLVLQLFGGLEKNLKNGTHLRGDVNCLLVRVCNRKGLHNGA